MENNNIDIWKSRAVVSFEATALFAVMAGTKENP
jgi:hypothetical protein